MDMYIHCDGGFGNRFNVLLSGLYLAEQANLTPKIIWKSNNWCGAELEDLFDTKFQNYNEFDRFTFFKQPLTILIHENQFGQPINYQDPRQFVSLEHARQQVTLNNLPVFYFTNLIPQWVDKHYVINNILPKIQFLSSLKEEAKRIINENTNGSYVGIHLRMTDFPTRDYSKVESYYNFVRSNPDKKFFVCSDDPDVEKYYCGLSNVFTRPKNSYAEKLIKDQDWYHCIRDSNDNQWNFNINRPKNSVQEAIIDLLILSRSEIISTNPDSTFLQTAYLLSHINKG